MPGLPGASGSASRDAPRPHQRPQNPDAVTLDIREAPAASRQQDQGHVAADKGAPPSTGPHTVDTADAWRASQQHKLHSPGDDNEPDAGARKGSTMGQDSARGARRKRRVVYLRKVVQDSYEYHGMNELGWFCVFAVLTNVVLYLHWSDTTAVFKNTVQASFTGFGNPDWQSQTMAGAGTMSDAIQYTTGWLAFQIEQSSSIGWGNMSATSAERVRIGEYADMVYARLIVNLDNNCDYPSLSCYRDDPELPPGYLESLGWVNVGDMDFRVSTAARSNWLAYTVIAPHIDGKNGTLAAYQFRLSQVTNNTAQSWSVPGMEPPDSGEPTAIDQFPYLAKYAYSFGVDLLAVNVLGDAHHPEAAVFSMQFQRRDVPRNKPDKTLWQITTTVPVRWSMYWNSWDYARAAGEFVLVVWLIMITHSQLVQLRTTIAQTGSVTPFFKTSWNVFEMLSTLMVYAWILYYLALVVVLHLRAPTWHMTSWDVDNASQQELNDMEAFANWYSAWLYGCILVDALVCLRIVRYMRIHPGLKAFYQVFVIAAREFLDFFIFLAYILLLLGSAVFAFFQLSGGNQQFLRYSDGISVMSRLTFGFLSFEDFQSQALGLGSAAAAVTFLFWLAVLLLVVYTQNIILAIVAEAYEEAKATLGASKISFVSLVFQRLIFTAVFSWYRMRMLWRQWRSACSCCAGRPRRRRGGAPYETQQNTPGDEHAAGGGGWHDGRGGRGGGGGGGEGDGGRGAGQRAARGPTVAGSRIEMAAAAAVAAVDAEIGAGRVGNANGGSSVPPPVFNNKDVGTLLGLGGAQVPAPMAGGGSRGVQERRSVGFDVSHEAEGQLGDGAGSGSLSERLQKLHSIQLDKEDHLMHVEVLTKAKTYKNSTWRAWAKRRWAGWALVRTPSVRMLQLLYQDCASYKLKVLPPWVQALEVAQESLSPDMLAALASCTCDADPPSGADGSLNFPNLMPGAGSELLDRDGLIAMFHVVLAMSDYLQARRSPNPFAGVSEAAVPMLVDGILMVYGFDAEDGDDSADMATDDLPPGQMDGEPSKGGGFLSRRKPRAEAGGGEGGGEGEGAATDAALRSMVRDQRRLEDQIIETEGQTWGQLTVLSKQLSNQQTAVTLQGQALAEATAAIGAIAAALGVAAPNKPGAAAPALARTSSGRRMPGLPRSLSMASNTSNQAAASTLLAASPAPPAASPAQDDGTQAAAPSTDETVAALQEELAAQRHMLQAILGLLQDQQGRPQGGA